MSGLYLEYDARVFDILNTQEVDTQIITNVWTDFGGEIDVRNYNRLSLYLVVDANSSTNIQLKVLAKHTKGHADEFNLPIRSVQSDKIRVNPVYYELDTDSDQKIQLDITVPVGCWVQLQVKDDASGSGEISGSYMLSYQ